MMNLHSKQGIVVISVFILSLIFLTGCNASGQSSIQVDSVQVTTDASQQPVVTPTYAFRTSQPGTVTIMGELLVPNPTVLLPAADDAIFLVPLDTSQSVTGIPSFEIGEVPQADVDEATGSFVFTDITEGSYAVVVLTYGGNQIPAHKYGGSELIIINITEEDKGTTIDLGKIVL